MSKPSAWERFGILMLGLAEEGGGTLTEAGLTVKWNALKEYDIELITKGVNYLAKNRTKTYPQVPTIQEIIEAIEIVQNPELAISDKSRAEFQANGVWLFLKTHGSNAVPEFDDPITQVLMTQSWPYNSWARTMTEKEHPFWKKDFIRAYLAYAGTIDTFKRLNVGFDLLKLSRSFTKRIPSLTKTVLQIPEVT